MEPVRYSISQEMHVAFWKLQFASSLKRGLLFLAGLIVVLSGLAFMIDGWILALSAAVGGVIGAALVTLASRYFFLPRQSAKVWRDHALIKEEMEITMSDDGFSIHQASAHVDALWSNMIAWDENDDLLAIFLNQQMAYILPKDQVDDAHLTFARDQLVASGLTTKGKRRK